MVGDQTRGVTSPPSGIGGSCGVALGSIWLWWFWYDLARLDWVELVPVGSPRVETRGWGGPSAGLKDIQVLIKQQSVLILRLESKGAADGLDRGFEGGRGGERLPEEGGDSALVA